MGAAQVGVLDAVVFATSSPQHPQRPQHPQHPQREQHEPGQAPNQSQTACRPEPAGAARNRRKAARRASPSSGLEPSGPGYAPGMITAVHALLYADDADAARRFFREVLDFPFVDAHDGWLIFKTGPSEIGVHPTRAELQAKGWAVGHAHEISLMCDDIEETVTELSAKGAEFTTGIEETSFGRTTKMRVPGAGEMLVYQPLHKTAYGL